MTRSQRIILYLFLLPNSLILLFWLLADVSYAWSTIEQVSHLEGHSVSPVAVIDGNGNTHAIWINTATSGQVLLYSWRNGQTWHEPIQISSSSQLANTPQLIVTPNNQLLALWIETPTSLKSSQLVYSLKEEGKDWTAPRTLSPNTHLYSGAASLAVHEKLVYAVWPVDSNEDNYADVLYMATWNGSSWSVPTLLPIQTGSLDAADIAFDSTGKLHLVWDGNRTSQPENLQDYEIYYAVLANNSWSAVTNISHTGGYSFYPSLAIERADKLHVVWMEGFNSFEPGIPLFDHVFYQRFEQNQWLAQAQLLSSTGNIGVAFPQAVADNAGAVHFIWSQNSASIDNLSLRIYYSRWDGESLYAPIKLIEPLDPERGQSIVNLAQPFSSTVDSTDLRLIWAGGDSNSISQIFYSQQSGFQISLAGTTAETQLAESPALAGSSADDLHCVWMEGTTNSRIRYSHWNGVLWSNPALLSTSVSGFPRVAVDPQHTPHVVWHQDGNNTGTRIYYSRLIATDWTSPTQISLMDEAALSPDIAIDSNGDVHVVWIMNKMARDLNYGVYYRRTINKGGEWQPIEEVSPVGHNTRTPRLALDKSGTPYVVWYDTEEQEIYYTTRKPNGWVAPINISHTPKLLSNVIVSSQGPDITLDNTGNIHIAWLDSVSRSQLDSVSYAALTTTGWLSHTVMSRPDVVRNMDMAGGLNVRIEAAKDGTIHVLWHDVAEGSLLQIYDSYKIANTDRWSTPTIITPDSTNASRADAYVDPKGHLHHVWISREQSTQIRYQRNERFNWIKVMNQSGTPQANAAIYRNGIEIGKTSTQGILLSDSLTISDELVALAPVAEYAGERDGHASPGTQNNWAYRTYLTNWHYDSNGNRIGSRVVDPHHEQLLIVHAQNPLIVFNLVMSLEWAADAADLQQFTEMIQLASQYLFDVTNGQMVIGYVAIYVEGQQWESSDIQVFAFNYNRPHSGINAIRSFLRTPIQLGRSWSGETGDSEVIGAWNKPAGYRTVVHEFSHYAFGLWDSYEGYLFDQNNNPTRKIGAACTDTNIQSMGGNDATNASIMFYQYFASEFSMRGTSAWSDICGSTAQFNMNHESDWETIQRLFADTQTPPRWTIQTPKETGILSGPVSFPLTGFPTIHTVEPISTTKTPLQLIGSPNAIHSALVTLYVHKEGHTEAIDQGYTDAKGRIVIYGARDGDRIDALSFDAVNHGRGYLQAGVTNTVVMSSMVVADNVDSSNIQLAKPRFFRLFPTSDNRKIDLQFSGFGVGASLEAELSLPGLTNVATSPLEYRALTSEHRAFLVPQFERKEQQINSIGQIQILGSDIDNRPIYFVDRFSISSLKQNLPQQLSSPDGAFKITVHQTIASGELGYLLIDEQSNFSLPITTTSLSPVYGIHLSGATGAFDSPITLSILAKEMPLAAPNNLAIVRFDENSQQWQPLPTYWDSTQSSASTSTIKTGLYSLIQLQRTEQLYLPVIFR